VFNGTGRILYLNFANMGACVICLYICFVKKTVDLKKKKFQTHQGGGGGLL